MRYGYCSHGLGLEFTSSLITTLMIENQINEYINIYFLKHYKNQPPPPPPPQKKCTE